MDIDTDRESRSFSSSWSPVARALSDMICPVTNGEILDVMYQLVGQDIRPDLNLEDRCEYLEHMLLGAGYLRCSGKGYKETERVAVIHGFFRRIFPQFLTTGFEVTTPEGPPDSDKVTRYAARLGLYLQPTKLQSLRWWLTIESSWNTLEMSIDTWLCPHCALKFEDASNRWSHIYALHSRRVMFPESFE